MATPGLRAVASSYPMLFRRRAWRRQPWTQTWSNLGLDPRLAREIGFSSTGDWPVPDGLSAERNGRTPGCRGRHTSTGEETDQPAQATEMSAFPAVPGPRDRGACSSWRVRLRPGGKAPEANCRISDSDQWMPLTTGRGFRTDHVALTIKLVQRLGPLTDRAGRGRRRVVTAVGSC